jgi:hypothetical protein
MQEQVPWNAKVPSRLHAPVTTYEFGMADPVRVDKAAYGKKPAVSQVIEIEQCGSCSFVRIRAAVHSPECCFCDMLIVFANNGNNNKNAWDLKSTRGLGKLTFRVVCV